MRTRCPHCNGPCTIRKTTQVSSTYREVTLSCNNTDCGHVFVASVSPVRTLSPSSIPDPDVNIPISTHIDRRALVKALSE
ncbi:ogr/Delta-like zinc finger family protein [Veronia pacifica]|uniref:ogr/Delta-like zinc finger family protein n=1 Tax=Veronia pacifica TaxID=1080227 RepID=UPI0009F58F5D|nr:ogr/Delta-like zinc finger family protein [Veronia pacifica]